MDFMAVVQVVVRLKLAIPTQAASPYSGNFSQLMSVAFQMALKKTPK
jgi:hypothetical protein